jgi:uncharacterized protein YkwD
MVRWLRALAVVGLSSVVGLVAYGATATQDKRKDTFRLFAEEQQLLDLTNQERKRQDLPLFRPDPTLFKVARGHSANMARQEKMEHVLDNKTPYQRIKEAGYRYSVAGENVAYGEVEMEDVMKGWMASPKHRANILNPRYTEIGLGLSRTDKGVVYYTQVFATPKKTN